MIKAELFLQKAAFVTSIKEDLCKLNYKPRRELVPGSLQVYPLEKDGVLYGAIQMGKHRFYAIEKDKPEYFTSIAKFTCMETGRRGREAFKGTEL